ITSGKIPKSIKEQTRIILINIKSIIQAAKLEIKNIIKTTIFTTNLKNFDKINETYEKFFIDNISPFPARSCVEVKALPKNVKIEIAAIAYYKIN
ncbi:hypothetical protein K4105_04415, partial [Buchnera aphidicola]|nr:hypothetical protein [Buchnera aphidicola]